MRGFILLTVLLARINAQDLDDSKKINVEGCGRRPFANVNEKIVGGQKAKVGDWGWQVALKRDGEFRCGGSLINSQWILTAAHCVRGSTIPSDYTMLIGAHNRVKIESWATRSSVSRVIIHPDWIDERINDVALIKLSAPVKYSDYVIPVCIDDGSKDYTSASAWTSGWGTVTNSGLEFGGNHPVELNNVQIKVLNKQRCRAKFPGTVSRVEVCAGDNEGGACQGDSGGPLVVKNLVNGKWYSHGVTSWSRGCHRGGFYARTSAFYSWIQQTIAAY